MLTYEAMPTTHEDHKPKTENGFLVLCAAEGPTFIKKGTSKTIRTGVKLKIPAKYLCAVSQRQKHGNGHVFMDPNYYTPSQKLGEDGKPVEGSEGEGLTGEISVSVQAPSNVDLNVRVGEAFAVAFLLQPALEEPKAEKTSKK